MRKVIAGINMTIDGVFDHIAVNPDAEVHDHYTNLIQQADVILYGKTTYQLMEYWRPFVKTPSGEKAMDDFATAIGKIRKIVFSNTLRSIDWDSAELSDKSVEETLSDLKRLPDGNILIGSRSLIIQLMLLNLIDEYQLCMHPVIAAKGRQLFENVEVRKEFELVGTKKFKSGAILLYYKKASV
ncbi:dihydrofolate reductase family protein [Flavobacterium silvaticum]|uniref:Dihydrofolate reductase n=1 Tax=Flavobacterium silvaticum TaxID=1852020 RepID=A0A972FIZ3_9FLAO|nr:dihydrofolate reductase family protein [Flavobacterium silvaticum]NMH26836.1 dihydrofolate reductase [Flavobacterium silvaticum]